MSLFNNRREGVLEKIELTFGGRGNQVMTISGERYATWINYTNWPKVGDVVSFRVYKEFGVRCADNLRIEKPAAAPEV